MAEERKVNEERDGTSNIWEEMALRERKAAAKRAGYQRISDFEAQEELQRALRESKEDEKHGEEKKDDRRGTAEAAPAHGSRAKAGMAAVASAAAAPAVNGPYVDEDDDGENGFYEDSSDGDGDSGTGCRSGGGGDSSSGGGGDSSSGGGKTGGASNRGTAEDRGQPGAGAAAAAAGGIGTAEEESEPYTDVMVRLSEDVLRRIVLFLDPDSIVHCCFVNRHWAFAGDESVFMELCHRTYLTQSQKKALNVARWQSWRGMFIQRPRLRTNGMYFLKHSFIKTPVRDMTSNYTPGTILEVVWFRYFRFNADGRVAYGLLHEPPKEAIRLFRANSPRFVWGRYSINRREVTVDIPASYAHIRFRLTVENGERGHFTQLVLQEHTSKARSDPRGTRCWHKVTPDDLFKYRRVWVI